MQLSRRGLGHHLRQHSSGLAKYRAGAFVASGQGAISATRYRNSDRSLAMRSGLCAFTKADLYLPRFTINREQSGLF